MRYGGHVIADMDFCKEATCRILILLSSGYLKISLVKVSSKDCAL